MAITSTIICERCEKEVKVTYPGRLSFAPPKLCNKCTEEEEIEEKESFLNKLKVLSIEDRIARLEGIEYEKFKSRPEPRKDILLG